MTLWTSFVYNTYSNKIFSDEAKIILAKYFNFYRNTSNLNGEISASIYRQTRLLPEGVQVNVIRWWIIYAPVQGKTQGDLTEFHLQANTAHVVDHSSKHIARWIPKSVQNIQMDDKTTKMPRKKVFLTGYLYIISKNVYPQHATNLYLFYKLPK